jgi:dTDP-4-dehydrorhamnose 3,5-epimerase
MEIQEFTIKGPKLITLKAFPDDRGFFVERFKLNFCESIGVERFVQDNFSRSKPNVLRGLHYQWDQPQGKLVTALRGVIYDVAVDIRKGSPTYGQHVSVVLDGNKPSWFWIPPGFAHGFYVMGHEEADVMYKVDNYWNGKGESGIVWNDPQFNIQWPSQQPLLSPKDAICQSFDQYSQDPKFFYS